MARLQRVMTALFMLLPELGGPVMKLRKLIPLLGLTVLLGGSALAVEGCVAETPVPAYGYNAPYYPYGPTYSSPPIVLGDWDEHREWHNRDWWVSNRRPWVEQHHHEWLSARPAPHDAYGHEHARRD